jgi:His-Xaa-Ser system radical SAM maturase HxsC
MISLRGRAASVRLERPLQRRVWLLTDRPQPRVPRAAQAQLIESGAEHSAGFDLYIKKSDAPEREEGATCIRLPPQLDHLAPGDVLSVSSDGTRLGVLWRARSKQNSILLTERCDHYCLMCSQPPKTANDDWLLEDAYELIRLLPPTTTSIGFTGGEPTLYGERLIDLLKLCRNLVPDAGVHILSNGRRFSDAEFARAYANVHNPNMMVGIPIYGSEPSYHDYVVQSHGAFDATVRGILNLAALQQRVEIRVVIHKQTAPYLVEIAEFIGRNLPFVDQVALMGLEMIGFARANIDEVWIDPIEYRDELTGAATILDRLGIHTMIYNHQLCLIDPRVWRFAVKSISDWKNEYHPECLDCTVMNDCGGFFYSAKYRMSDHIKAIRERKDVALLTAAHN